MFDKCHYEWIYNDFSTQVRIFMAQKKTFDFMNRLGDDVGEAIKDLDTPQSVRMCLDLFDLGNYYYKVANRIGEQWVEVK